MTELLFLALFFRLLKPGGRAAAIVPDGALSGASNAHKMLRRSGCSPNRRRPEQAAHRGSVRVSNR